MCCGSAQAACLALRQATCEWSWHRLAAVTCSNHLIHCKGQIGNGHFSSHYSCFQIKPDFEHSQTKCFSRPWDHVTPQIIHTINPFFYGLPWMGWFVFLFIQRDGTDELGRKSTGRWGSSKQLGWYFLPAHQQSSPDSPLQSRLTWLRQERRVSGETCSSSRCAYGTSIQSVPGCGTTRLLGMRPASDGQRCDCFPHVC